MMEKRFW